MSKRFIFPEQSGDRKKPRLDIRVSDHNFPLSQNASFNNVADHFEDIDDELLLQASQACEQACNASMLPAYSQFMPPALASTQLPSGAGSSTSVNIFSFKKPTASLTNAGPTHLKDKCGLISSPLHGIAKKVGVIQTIDLKDNYFTDKVLDKQDTDYVYRQLLKLKEENAKLKSENGKLLEKCVTKEGEASILRTQLKNYQVAVDNARLEKIKAQEQVQFQWSEKLNVVSKQLCDLRTQLDTKNLEVISMKEKCKMLESNKIKLTQITVAGNELTRVNNSMVVSNSFLASQQRRVKTVSSTVQTDNTPQLMKLSKPCRSEKTNLTEILPLIMDSKVDEQHYLLDYNEKLKKPNDFSPNKCRIYSSFYRLPSSTDYVNSSNATSKATLSSIYEDLTCIAACNNDVEKAKDQYINIFNATKAALETVQCQLEAVSRRLTSAFQKEMDRLYMETTTTYIAVAERDLILGKALFEEEQSILARRMTAVLRIVLSDSKALQFFNKTQRPAHEASGSGGTNEFVDLLCRICSLLDNNSCGVLYSGLLMSIAVLLETLAASSLHDKQVLDIVKRVASCRPLLFVPRRLLATLCRLWNRGSTLCSNGGNLKVDYEQGVLLYKKDTCLLQILLRQIESSLKCMERQGLVDEVVETTGHLLQLHSDSSSKETDEQDRAECKCVQMLVQIIVYALRICSTMLDDPGGPNAVETSLSGRQKALLAVCRSGLAALYRLTLRTLDLAPQLGSSEGHLHQYCEQMQRHHHDEFHSTMLSEMVSSFQAAAEEAPSPFHRLAWLRSFDTFSLLD